MDFDICNHDPVWRVNTAKCFLCTVKFIQCEENPLCARHYAFCQVLDQLCITDNSMLQPLQENIQLVDFILNTFIKFFYQAKDINLKPSVLEVILWFVRSFGNHAVQVIASTIMVVDFDSATTKSCFHIFSLVLDLLQNVPIFLDRVMVSDQLISQTFLCLDIPNDSFRCVLLKLCSKFIAHHIAQDEGLERFGMFAKSTLTLFATSESVDVLVATIKVLHKCAESRDFQEWIAVGMGADVRKIAPTTKRYMDFQQCINHCITLLSKKKDIVFRLFADDLFASIKRAMLMQQDLVNQSVVKFIILLVSKQDLDKPFMDSDLPGFLYDSLQGTTNETLIRLIYDVILILSDEELFYSSCHAAHGLPAVCKSLLHLLTIDSSDTACAGYVVLQSLLDNTSSDVRLLQSLSSFDQTLHVITDGITNKNVRVQSHALEAACSFCKKHHFLHPIPFTDIEAMLQKIENYVRPAIDALRWNPTRLDSLSQSTGYDEEANIISHVFYFLDHCFRLLKQERESDEVEVKFAENLVGCLINTWMPCVQMNLSILSSSFVTQAFFSCLVSGFETGHGLDGLLEYMVSNSFLEHALKIKMKLPNAASVSAFLCILCSYFLHMSGMHQPDNDVFFRKGIPLFTGLATEILHLLREFSVSQQCAADNINLCVSVSVITVLSITAWFGDCCCSLDKLEESVIEWIMQHSSLSDIPVFALKLSLFLLSICQQEGSECDIPPKLLETLQSNDSLYVNHPAVLTSLLRTDDVVVERKIKIALVYHWLRDADESNCEFHSHPAVRHVIGLVLLHSDIASLIVESLLTCEKKTNSRKIILVLSAAVAESSLTDSESDESILEGSPLTDFLNVLGQYLPDVVFAYLSPDKIKQDFINVISSLFDLLEIVVKRNLLSDAATSRLLRQTLSFLSDTYESEDPSDIVISSMLHVVNLMLGTRTEPDIQIVLSHTRFVPGLQSSLHNFLNSTSDSVYRASYEIKILATMVRLQHVTKAKVVSSINLQIDLLLKYCFSEPRIECSLLLLWSSVYDCESRSQLLTLFLAPQAPRKTLLSDDDLLFAPLTKNNFMRLFLSALNASVKTFPGINIAALKCLLSMMRHVTGSRKWLNQLKSSPWLKIALEVNLADNDEAALKLCTEIQSFCQETTN